MTNFIENYFNIRNEKEKEIYLQRKHSRTLNIINKLLIFNNLKIIDNNKTILDIGCGDGSLVKHLNSQGITATGCDIK